MSDYRKDLTIACNRVGTLVEDLTKDIHPTTVLEALLMSWCAGFNKYTLPKIGPDDIGKLGFELAEHLEACAKEWCRKKSIELAERN